MAVYGYVRASTKKQIDSPETQKETIRGYAQFNKLGDVTFYGDPATSGKHEWDTRPAGKELFLAVRPGDHIIVGKLDRAFRRLKDCVNVLDRFERMGVRLHVCNVMGGALDLSSPMGRAMIQILGVFAELERAMISERTKDGLRGKKRKGVAHTRYPGYGFRWKKIQQDGKWVKVKERHDEERGVMRSILLWRMQDESWSWKQISDHLMYTLKVKTKEGKEWNENRVRRACEAEIRLQYAEQRANR